MHSKIRFAARGRKPMKGIFGLLKSKVGVGILVLGIGLAIAYTQGLGPFGPKSEQPAQEAPAEPVEQAPYASLPTATPTKKKCSEYVASAQKYPKSGIVVDPICWELLSMQAPADPVEQAPAEQAPVPEVIEQPAPEATATLEPAPCPQGMGPEIAVTVSYLEALQRTEGLSEELVIYKCQLQNFYSGCPEVVPCTTP